MECCKCGKDIDPTGHYCLMIRKSSDFNQYQIGDYYCCTKCCKLWDNLWDNRSDVAKNSGKFDPDDIHTIWLYIFFEEFLYPNPSRRDMK